MGGPLAAGVAGRASAAPKAVLPAGRGRRARFGGAAAAAAVSLVVTLAWVAPAPAASAGTPLPGVSPVKTGGHSKGKAKTRPKTTPTTAKRAPTTTTPAKPKPATAKPAKPKPAKAATPSKVTGNPAAIAFYRKVVKATAATDGVEQLYLSQGPLTQAKYASKRLSWAEMQPKETGYAPAVDIVFVGAAGGKVTFVADSVLYDGKGPDFPNFGLLLTAKGEVVLAGGAAARTTPAGKKTTVYPCAGDYGGPRVVAGYTKVGGTFGYSLLGHFDSLKLVDKGKEYQVTSTYPWSTSPARTATEVDTVPIATDLPSGTVINVSAGGKFEAFTMRFANVWYRSKLYPPETNGACAAYLKGVS